MSRRTSLVGLLVVTAVANLYAAGSGPATMAVITCEFGSRAVVEGVGMLYAEYPELRQTVAFQVYTPRDLSDEALKAIGDSRLVLILHGPMDRREDRRLAKQLGPQLARAAKTGGTVYGASDHLFPKDYDAGSFVIDPRLRSFFSEGSGSIKNGYLYVLTKTLGIKASYHEPAQLPGSFSLCRLYERRSHTLTADYDQYLAAYRKARSGFNPRLAVDRHRIHRPQPIARTGRCGLGGRIARKGRTQRASRVRLSFRRDHREFLLRRRR